MEHFSSYQTINQTIKPGQRDYVVKSSFPFLQISSVACGHYRVMTNGESRVQIQVLKRQDLFSIIQGKQKQEQTSETF